MSVKLLRDELIEFYQQHKNNTNVSKFDTDDLYKYYKGWMGVVCQKANPVLNRLTQKEKLEYLKKERIPKHYRGTPFGEAYDKLELLVSRMLGFEYTKYPYEECASYYQSCEKYCDDLLIWLKEKEEPKETA